MSATKRFSVASQGGIALFSLSHGRHCFVAAAPVSSAPSAPAAAVGLLSDLSARLEAAIVAGRAGLDGAALTRWRGR